MTAANEPDGVDRDGVGPTQIGGLVGPQGKSRAGAALFVDIVGFSRLTGRLAMRGPRGCEDVSQLLDAYFAQMMKVVLERGGDVVAVVGDALISVWETSDAEPDALPRAVACGRAMQKALHSLREDIGTPIRHRISVARGDIVRLTLGGYRGVWYDVTGGSAISDATAANELAGTEDVIVAGSTSHGSGRLAALASADLLPAMRPAPRGGVQDVPREPWLDWPICTSAPPAGCEHAAGEFRTLTILSAGLIPAPRFDQRNLEMLQRDVLRVQRAVVEFDGFVDGVSVDDKGLVVHTLFGLPTGRQQDAAARAVQAANAAQSAFAGSRELSIGIATGLVFYGEYGPSRRRIASALGPEVNLAARLMQAASGGTLCDTRTAQRARRKVRFVEAGKIRLKGIGDAVTVVQPSGRAHTPTASRRNLVGRDAERALLSARLTSLAAGAGGAVLVIGPAGIGKSLLLRDVVRGARVRRLPVVSVTANLVDRHSPFALWGSVIRRLLFSAVPENPRSFAAAIATALASEPGHLAYTSMLADVLRVGNSEAPRSDPMLGSAHRSTIERLLLRLLQVAVQDRPTVLTIDDVQFVDDVSFEALERVIDAVPNVLVVGAARAGDPDGEAAVNRLRHGRDVTVLSLDPLTRESIAALLAQSLGGEAIDPALLAFIEHRTGGHPLHIAELALSLSEAGIVEIASGTCKLRPDASEQLLGTVPESLRELIIERIDRLSPFERLLLRVASVAGDAVPERLLRDAPILSAEEGEIATAIEALVQADFLAVETAADATSISFRHDALRSIAYEQMLFAQRRRIHRELAEWFERHAGDREASAAPLAMHWEGAEEFLRAIDNLELLAARSLRLFATHEAIGHARRAFELADTHRLPIDPLRRAKWRLLLADGHNELFDHPEASLHFGTVLALVGRRPAIGKFAQFRSVVREAVHQTLRRAQMPPRARCGADQLRLAAHAHERLAEIAYFDNQSLTTVLHTLAALNCAEQAGSHREIVEGLASLSIGLSVAGARRLAAFYNRRSLEVAAEEGSAHDVAYSRLVDAVYSAALGRWETVSDSCRTAASLFRHLGADLRWQQTKATSCYASLTRGRFDEAAVDLEELEMSVGRDGPVQIRAWTACARLILELARDALQPPMLQAAADAYSEPALNGGERLLCEGLLAAGHYRCGNVQAASGWVARGVDRLRREAPTAWHLTEGIAGLAETILKARLDAPGLLLDGVVPADADQDVVAALRRYGRRIPVAEPRAAIVSAQFALLDGREAAGRKWLARATAAATRLGMPHVRTQAASIERRSRAEGVGFEVETTRR